MNVPRREKGGGEVHSAGGVRNFSEYCVRKEKKEEENEIVFVKYVSMKL